jgi:hypothetical protein
VQHPPGQEAQSRAKTLASSLCPAALEQAQALELLRARCKCSRPKRRSADGLRLRTQMRPPVSLGLFSPVFGLSTECRQHDYSTLSTCTRLISPSVSKIKNRHQSRPQVLPPSVPAAHPPGVPAMCPPGVPATYHKAKQGGENRVNYFRHNPAATSLRAVKTARSNKR